MVWYQSTALLDGLGTLLFSVCLITYYIVFQKQYSFLKQSSILLQTLVTRLALFLPLYSSTVYLSLLVPILHPVVEIFLTLSEAGTFYTCFAMFIENLGGVDQTIRLLEKQNKKACCPCAFVCCPSEHKFFYLQIKSSLWYFIYVRTIIVIAIAICEYLEIKALVSILGLISACFVLWVFIGLVNLYEMIYEESLNLKPTLKILLIKVTVGAMVIQLLIANFLIEYKVVNAKESDDYSSEVMGFRLYCFIILCEFVFFSAVTLWTFSHPVARNSELTDDTAAVSKVEDEPPALSRTAYFLQVLNYSDLVGRFDAAPLYEPLLP